MWRSLLKLLLLGVLLCLPGCGEKDGPTIVVQFINGSGISSSTDPFTDANVVDVVFLVVNQPPTTNVLDGSGSVAIPAGTMLDTNLDGLPDNLAYPTTCDLTFVAGCGFPRDTTSYNLEDLPLNHRYTVSVRFRNSLGTELYEGTSNAFNNIESPAPTVSIVVNLVTS